MKIFEPKILTAFKNYKSKDYVSDIMAGVIVAIIALPLSIALAIASGAAPATGLFTANGQPAKPGRMSPDSRGRGRYLF